MRNQYSDSPAGSPLTLAFDTGSPLTSVALGRGNAVLAAREAAGGRSSRHLLALIDGLLDEHSIHRGDLDRVIAARGPGSFTGLRVGLATALGLHQALGLAATAVGSLQLLARAVAVPGDGRPVVAAIDALRGEWFTQTFDDGGAGAPLGDAAIVAPAALLETGPCRLTGFSLEPLAAGRAGDRIEIVPAKALAPTLLEIAADPGLAWDPAALIEPLYLRPPAAATA